MFNSPKEFAKYCYEAGCGDRYDAIAALFECAKSWPHVPAIFWTDVLLEIDEMVGA